jgi:hypothetical protein
VDGGPQHEVSYAHGWVDRQIERAIAEAQAAGWFDPDDDATVDRLATMVLARPLPPAVHRHAARELEAGANDGC